MVLVSNLKFAIWLSHTELKFAIAITITILRALIKSWKLPPGGAIAVPNFERAIINIIMWY